MACSFTRNVTRYWTNQVVSRPGIRADGQAKPVRLLKYFVNIFKQVFHGNIIWQFIRRICDGLEIEQIVFYRKLRNCCGSKMTGIVLALGCLLHVVIK